MVEETTDIGVAQRFLEDLAVGMSDRSSRAVAENDIERFAEVSGDHNPVHMDEEFAAQTQFGSRIAHGMLTVSFISAALANRLPGPGCVYLNQSLSFRAPVRIGDTVTVELVITNIRAIRHRVTLSTVARVGETIVVDGEAVAFVPSRA